MPGRGSRYQNATTFRSADGQRPRRIGPATPVLEYRIKEGDRLDLLALYFYNNDRRWWRLLDANPWVVFGDDLSLADHVGETLLVPAESEQGGKP